MNVQDVEHHINSLQASKKPRSKAADNSVGNNDGAIDATKKENVGLSIYVYVSRLASCLQDLSICRGEVVTGSNASCRHHLHRAAPVDRGDRCDRSYRIRIFKKKSVRRCDVPSLCSLTANYPGQKISSPWRR